MTTRRRTTTPSKIDLNVCQSCKQVITIMVFRGTGYCSDNCRKVLSGERSVDGS